MFVSVLYQLTTVSCFPTPFDPPPPLLFGVGGSFNGATCMTMNMIKVDV